jgi:putrescine transport system substrate-binding protein
MSAAPRSSKAWAPALAIAVAACSQGSKPLATVDASAALNPDKSLSKLSERVLNVYNWGNFIDSSVVPSFEKEYGIKVNYSVYDGNEQLETALLTGHSNYDVVVPGGAFFDRQIKAGVYQKLDKARLPNLRNVDPEAVRGMAVYDLGNQYGVAYTWLTTTGIGYNVASIKTRLVNAPIQSWRLVFDPSIVKQFQSCGVSVLDAPDDVLDSVLSFLGKDPNSDSLADLKQAEQVLLSVRPYIRQVDSTHYVDDLANGDLCIALGWSGDITQARDHAKEAGKPVEIAYSIPTEGTISIFDVFAIPVDSPHPANAHIFINYMLRPDVAAKNSNAIKYAISVLDAMPMVNEALRNDAGIYPPANVQKRLVPQRARSQNFARSLTRMWTRFKTGT